MAIQIGNVCVDTNDLKRASEFWQAVTGYKVSSSDDSTVYFEDPEQKASGLSLQLVPEKRQGKNRLHVDFFTSDLDGEVKRVKGLGATEVASYDGWVVLKDLDDNEFCICAA
ncbi:VOC family protein [Streptomyces tendae]|uniref:VOC family protein n=1 Tax=Streptomyces tendae TaxID=1932 RepID=A0A6B3QP66_STRTE|nr:MULTISPECIES: VOC family protein [Streptomyces]BET45187.1 VOC family protein [Kitasatospora aureofaciens]MBQ0968649.1 VOC family protein [Streptomyces sp. RK74B]MBQ1008678.1 VOC family protein [Streptomyces sp. RK23]MZG15454.1 VOC family protein [Streptomyces sp. SID5914]NEV89896.1 VOC family protein [Streptomyces tendae]